MKKILFSLFVLFTLVYETSAQQDTHYTGYMFNQLVQNPAYAGSRDVVSVMAYYRHQWSAIEQAPRDFTISAHGPYKNQRKVGLGIFAESDWIGVHNRLSLFASYSYKFNLGNNGLLSVGLQGGILRYSSNFSEIGNLQDPSDPLFVEDQRRLLPNFGLGVFYYTNQFYIGFSIPHLLNNKILDEVGALSNQERHYFLSAGTVIPINDQIKIKPSVMLKSVPAEAPLSMDLSFSVILKNSLLVGAAHRLTESVSVFAEYQFNRNLRAGYVYDFTIQHVANTWGSHELFVGYEFGMEMEKIKTPRFF